MASGDEAYPPHGIEAFFSNLLKRIIGLSSITVSDIEGVVLFNFPSKKQNLEEAIITSRLINAFHIHLEQAERISALGKLNYVSAFDSTSTMVQLNVYPLVVTFQLDSSANVGELIEILPICKIALENVRKAIEMNPVVEEQ